MAFNTIFKRLLSTSTPSTLSTATFKGSFNKPTINANLSDNIKILINEAQKNKKSTYSAINEYIKSIKPIKNNNISKNNTDNINNLLPPKPIQGKRKPYTKRDIIDINDKPWP